MKATKLALALVAATGISAIATPAMAYEAGDILVRGRIITVSPRDNSGELFANGTAIAGSGVGVDSDTVPELDFTYMLDKNWGAELILAYSKHHITANGTISSYGQVVSVNVLPPTLTVQYHFNSDSTIRPYIGAGVNYTSFFNQKVTGQLANGYPNAKFKVSSSWGLAAQAGVDIAVNDDWFVNADVKYIDMNTTAKFSNTAVGSARINVDINPIVWGIGVGRRF